MVTITSAYIRSEINRQTELSKAIARAQSDVSTGTRLQAASDDPVASARVAVIRRSQANEAVWSANVEAGTTQASQVDGALTAVQTSLDRARELMLTARSGTASAEDRATIASQLAGLREDVAAQVGAKDANGQPLFPEGAPLKLPIGDGVTATATVSRGQAFGDLDSMLGDAISSLGIDDATRRDVASGKALDGLAAAGSRLADVQGEQGVRMQRLDAAKERFASSAIQLSETKGALAGTDMETTISFIQQSLLQLNAAQTTFARISQKTLFDILG